ncbi:MAG: hypothetical protein LBO66_05015 [Deltaproteobacteria bacterium]|jgi:hypothetical protein|nr:hypothetical protein [Deltaproteobacteria bacterium]
MMDTQIFNLPLSVPALSLYILIAELADLGIRPTPEEIAARFPAPEGERDTALADLLSYGVIYPNGPGGDFPLSYHPNPASRWKPRAEGR